MLSKCLVGVLAPPSPETIRRNSASIVKSKYMYIVSVLKIQVSSGVDYCIYRKYYTLLMYKWISSGFGVSTKVGPLPLLACISALGHHDTKIISVLICRKQGRFSQGHQDTARW